MNKEMLGVTIIERVLAKSDYIISNINRNDREPSWDGYIEVYNKATHNHSKNSLIERVPVQVKGHEDEDLSQENISYDIDVADLRNYLYAGGTIFFVVYVDCDGENEHIYYEKFLPFELKKILKSCKSNQKKKSIRLKSFSKDKNDISNLLLNFANDMQKQKGAISTEIVSIEELTERGYIQELSFGYTDVNYNQENPFAFMFKNDSYLYAKFPFGVVQPVEHLEKIDSAITEISAPVRIGTKKYYSKYRIVLKENCEEIHIGKSIIFSSDRIEKTSKFSFTLKGSLSERIKDISFLMTVLEAREFWVNNIQITLNGANENDFAEFNQEALRDELNGLMDIKNVLDYLKVKDELEMDSITESDINKLSFIVEAIGNNKEIPMKEVKQPIGNINICNLKILIVLLKNETNDLYRIYCLSDAPLIYKGVDDKGNEIDSTIYVRLKSEDLLTISNWDFDDIIEKVYAVKPSEIFGTQVVDLLLEVILAYDKSKNKKFLLLSENLITWLDKNSQYISKDVLDINRLQIVKRRRSLNDTEIARLCELAESSKSSEDIRTAAYLLMDNKKAAQIHFKNLTVEVQEIFKNYPIAYFWNE